jgi:flavin-dependent dehydrogenase
MHDRREERQMYDVIVAGAGPAGSTAARLCAEHGLRTLLLEKEKIPREKPCAGGLSIAASRELGLSLPGNLIERRCRGMRLVVGETQTTVQVEHDVAYMVRRSSFDAFLAGEAARASPPPLSRESSRRMVLMAVIGAPAWSSCPVS